MLLRRPNNIEKHSLELESGVEWNDRDLWTDFCECLKKGIRNNFWMNLLFAQSVRLASSIANVFISLWIIRSSECNWCYSFALKTRKLLHNNLQVVMWTGTTKNWKLGLIYSKLLFSAYNRQQIVTCAKSQSFCDAVIFHSVFLAPFFFGGASTCFRVSTEWWMLSTNF